VPRTCCLRWTLRVAFKTRSCIAAGAAFREQTRWTRFRRRYGRPTRAWCVTEDHSHGTLPLGPYLPAIGGMHRQITYHSTARRTGCPDACSLKTLPDASLTTTLTFKDSGSWYEPHDADAAAKAAGCSISAHSSCSHSCGVLPRGLAALFVLLTPSRPPRRHCVDSTVWLFSADILSSRRNADSLRRCCAVTLSGRTLYWFYPKQHWYSDYATCIRTTTLLPPLPSTHTAGLTRCARRNAPSMA